MRGGGSCDKCCGREEEKKKDEMIKGEVEMGGTKVGKGKIKAGEESKENK